MQIRILTLRLMRCCIFFSFCRMEFKRPVGLPRFPVLLGEGFQRELDLNESSEDEDEDEDEVIDRPMISRQLIFQCPFL